MMSVEQSVEWELAGETEVLGENLPQFPNNVQYNPSRDLTNIKVGDVHYGRLRAFHLPLIICRAIPRLLIGLLTSQ
jgi:hypothetical protein